MAVKRHHLEHVRVLLAAGCDTTKRTRVRDWCWFLMSYGRVHCMQWCLSIPFEGCRLDRSNESSGCCSVHCMQLTSHHPQHSVAYVAAHTRDYTVGLAALHDVLHYFEACDMLKHTLCVHLKTVAHSVCVLRHHRMG